MRGEREAVRRWLDTFACPGPWRAVALVPTVYLDFAQEYLYKNTRPLTLGAQNVSGHAAAGPYTGESAAYMLAEVGAKYALISRANDSLEAYCARAAAARSAGLVPLAEKKFVPPPAPAEIYLTKLTRPRELTAAPPGDLLVDLEVFNAYCRK